MSPGTVSKALLFTLILLGCSGEAGETTTTSAVVTSTSAPAPTTAPPTTAPPSTTSTVAATTTPPLAEAPAGLEVFGGPDVGFTMWVPEGWETMDPSNFDPDVLAEALGDSFDEAIAEMVEGSFASGALLFAMDPSQTDGFFNNINVISVPATGFTADGVANMLAAQMEELVNAEDVTAEAVEVAAGEAARVTYSLPDFGNEGVLYQIFADDTEWVVTFSMADVDSFDHDVDELINSFQPVP